MGQYFNEKGKNSLTVLEGLLIFDLWLLLKSRRLLKGIVLFFIPILKILFFMSLGAGLLLLYVSANIKSNIHDHNTEYLNNKRDNPMLEQYLEISDDSKSDSTTLIKKLISIKSETMRLEKFVYRMNMNLRSMYNYQKNMDISLADFASEAVGGLVIDTPDTQPYYQSTSFQITMFGIPIWKPNHHTPRKVIQPWTQPGECWAFHGSQGKVEIELAHTAFIDQVTLEHIPASASITGNIDSAPKFFNVLGKFENQFIVIGTFTYKNNDIPSQTFKIKDPEIKNIPFKRVILQVLSNWGNQIYTCIYRFKVHGKMYNESNVKRSTNMQ